MAFSIHWRALLPDRSTVIGAICIGTVAVVLAAHNSTRTAHDLSVATAAQLSERLTSQRLLMRQLYPYLTASAHRNFCNPTAPRPAGLAAAETWLAILSTPYPVLLKRNPTLHQALQRAKTDLAATLMHYDVHTAYYTQLIHTPHVRWVTRAHRRPSQPMLSAQTQTLLSATPYLVVR